MKALTMVKKVYCEMQAQLSANCRMQLRGAKLVEGRLILIIPQIFLVYHKIPAHLGRQLAALHTHPWRRL